MPTLDPNLSIAIINESTPGNVANVLYIKDSSSTLSLTLATNSSTSIALHSASGNASQQNYSFLLHFQPGTIEITDLSIKVQNTTDSGTSWTDAPAGNWSIVPTRNTDNSVSLWFLTTTTPSVAPDTPLRVVLENVKPAPGSGRVGNVEWRINNGSDQESFCQTYLNIIDHLGQENIPLKASVDRGQYLLNDGSENDLKVNLINTGNTALDFTNASITVRFLVQREDETISYALMKTGDGVPENITIGSQNPSNSNSEGLNPEYTARSLGSLAPNAAISIEITPLTTSMPPGFTSIEIAYSEVVGYWDGKIVVPLQRGPLVAKDDNTFGGSLTLDSGDVQLKSGVLKIGDRSIQNTAGTLSLGNGDVQLNSGSLKISSDNAIGNKITLFDNTTTSQFGIGLSNTELVGYQMNYDVASADADHVFYAGGINGTGTELLRVQGDGNVNINAGSLTLGSGDVQLTSGSLTLDDGNVQLASGSLNFTPNRVGSKISLYGMSNVQHYGLGISSSQLDYTVDDASSNHVFYAGRIYKNDGTVDAIGTELMRIKGNGEVTVGGKYPLVMGEVLSLTTTVDTSKKYSGDADKPVLAGCYAGFGFSPTSNPAPNPGDIIVAYAWVDARILGGSGNDYLDYYMTLDVTQTVTHNEPKCFSPTQTWQAPSVRPATQRLYYSGVFIVPELESGVFLDSITCYVSGRTDDNWQLLNGNISATLLRLS